MKNINFLAAAVGLAFFLIVPVASAVEIEEEEVDIQELQRRIDIMSDEIDALTSGGSSGAVSQGFRTNVFGYGEMHYNRFTDGSKSDELETHRIVLGVYSRITDWIQLNAELDFEHGGQELELEMGYLDFLFQPAFNFRAGVVLVPVGFLNEFHEPNLFWTVERPEIQNKVIPTSWQGSGAGFWGSPLPGLNYRIYVLNGLQSVRPAGFSKGSGVGNGGNSGRFKESSGIRSGRLQSNKAISEDFAVTGRLEYSHPMVPGLQVGFSFYTSNTTQNQLAVDGRTTLLEGDMKYRKRWLDLNATIVNIDIDDAAELNTFAMAQGTASGVIPDRIFGWNAQVGVHLLQLLNIRTRHDVVPFYLHEDFDLHKGVPTGFARNSKRDTSVNTFGIAYLPVPQVALKMDFQDFQFGDGTSADQFNMGMAYLY